MKAQVAWIGSSPTAEEVAGKISALSGRPIMAKTELGRSWRGNSTYEDPEQNRQILTAEEEDFLTADVSTADMKDRMKTFFGVKAASMIDGIDLGGQACIQYRRRNRREKAVAAGIEQLKATSSWLKDKRIAEIRRDLEEASAHPVK